MIALLQHVILKIAHHGVQLHHGIAHGGSGGKYNATSAGNLVHIAALGEHIAGFLRLCLADAGHIPHFCMHVKVFERMRLVHKQAVNTQFLKIYGVVFFLVVEFFQICGQVLFCALHLLDRKFFILICFRFCDCVYDFVNLFLNNRFLPLRGDRDFFKLRVADNDRIKIASGDAGAEFFSVLRFKIFFCGYQNVCTGIERQEIAAPLFR